MYYHATWGIVSLVHGDDFVCMGNRQKIAKIRKALEDRFKIETQIMGSGTEEQSEARALNRIIRVTDEGWEYEADQRHADMLRQGLSLT